MQHRRECAVGHLLFQDACHVLVGVACMDDERQLGLARGGDMVAKALLLRDTRTLVVEVIQASLADGDHFGVAAQPHDLLHRHIQLLVRVVRMRPDGAEDIGVRVGDLQQPVEAADAGGDGAPSIRRRPPWPGR